MGRKWTKSRISREALKIKYLHRSPNKKVFNLYMTKTAYHEDSQVSNWTNSKLLKQFALVSLI